jgi:hypothetical protein
VKHPHPGGLESPIIVIIEFEIVGIIGNLITATPMGQQHIFI